MDRGRKRVAVVGTGMAGLVTAYLLHNDPEKKFDVTVFEIGTGPSLDSASISVPNPRNGGQERIDVPMRAFTGGYYHHLKAMYDFLRVKYRVQPFVFHFVCLDGSRSGHYFTHASNNHRFPPARHESVGLVQHLLELVFVSICYLWFAASCLFISAKHANADRVCETLDEYLRRIRLPRYFVTFYLLPLMSAVTTCSHEQLLGFPANDIVEYKRLITSGKQYVVSEGVQSVQSKLMTGLSVKFLSEVTTVRPEEGQISIFWRDLSASERSEEEWQDRYDHVVLAVPPNAVAKMYMPLRTVFSRIPTTAVSTVVHIDKKAAPNHDFLNLQKGRVAPMNSVPVAPAQNIYLRTTSYGTAGTEAAHVHNSGATVTSCPLLPIAKRDVVASSQFTRVLRTPQSRNIVNAIFGNMSQLNHIDEKLIRWRNGDENVWLVGSWCWDGMVLLEGCVVSAVRVSRALGAPVPWSS